MHGVKSLAFLFAGMTVFALPAPPVETAQPACSASTCKKIHMIYARATGEPGTIGHSVGSLMSSGFIEEFGSNHVYIEGLKYPADQIGAVTGALDPKGSKSAQLMASMAEKVMKECPTSNIILCGYSQGAEQVHGALMNLGPDGKNISAAITFGDPLNKALNWGQLPKTRTKVYCDAEDQVCKGTANITDAHFTYIHNNNTAEAVMWVADLVKKDETTRMSKTS